MRTCFLILSLLCVPTFSQSSIYSLTLFNQPVIEEMPVIGTDDTKNPYSKGLGQRIAGGVVTGLGALDILSGLLIDASDVYADSYEESLNDRELGDGLEKFVWIAGIVQFSIGLPILISGTVKYSKWKAWEDKHGRVSYDPKSGDLVISF